MDLLPTGSNELVYIQTDKVSITIKGQAAHPNFSGAEYMSGDSTLKVYCSDSFDIGSSSSPHLVHHFQQPQEAGCDQGGQRRSKGEDDY